MDEPSPGPKPQVLRPVYGRLFGQPNRLPRYEAHQLIFGVL